MTNILNACKSWLYYKAKGGGFNGGMMIKGGIGFNSNSTNMFTMNFVHGPSKFKWLGDILHLIKEQE